MSYLFVSYIYTQFKVLEKVLRFLIFFTGKDIIKDKHNSTEISKYVWYVNNIQGSIDSLFSFSFLFSFKNRSPFYRLLGSN